MITFRFSTLGGLCASMLLAALTSPLAAKNPTADKDLHQYCRQVRNDDAIRNYTHDLFDETVKVYMKGSPDRKGAVDESEFENQAQYRCMDGKVMVCFIGANLPCVKINTAKDNPGAAAACKDAKDGETPAAAQVGHDSAYSFVCRGGKAVVDGEAWTLDKRGFAKEIWTELPD